MNFTADMVVQGDLSAGNIIIYDYLHRKRGPVFLQRNLARAFRFHQRVAHEGFNRFPDSGSTARKLWKPPTWESLDQMIDRAGLHGTFILDVLNLVPLNNKSTGSKVDNAKRQVKKTRSSALANCSFQLTIFRDDGRKSILPNYEATLHRSMLQEKAIDICTDRIALSNDDLAPNKDASGGSAKHRMLLYLDFASEDDARAVYDYMGIDKMSSSSTRLEARHGNITDLAFQKMTLRLTDLITNEPVLSLDVTIGRIDTANESILETHNRHTRNLRQSALLTSTRDSQKYRIVYIWPEDKHKQKEVRGIKCYQPRCGRSMTNVNELLMHLRNTHCLHDHDCMDTGPDEQGVHKYVISCTVSNIESQHRASDRTDDPREMMIEAPEQSFEIDKSVQGDQSWENTARNPRVIRSVGSKLHPTQAREIVVGPQRKLPEQVIAKSACTKKTYIVPKPPAGVTFFASITKQPLKPGAQLSESDDDVDEEWIKLRKSAEIDKEYASDATKRFLKQFDAHMGEEHLESDVHLGESVVRFARKQAQWIWSAAVFDEFEQKLEELWEDNIISRDILDGSLRIVQSKRPGKEPKDLSQGIAGINLMSNTSSTAATRTISSRSKRERKGKGRALVPENGQLTPATTDSDGDVAMKEAAEGQGFKRDSTVNGVEKAVPYDMCYCGQDALSSSTISFSPAIACINIVRYRIFIFFFSSPSSILPLANSSQDCIRRTFHVSCVEKRANGPIERPDPRHRTWTCDECKHASLTGS